MKKALSLILALSLCLSLCACGSKTESITISMSNWEKYFEVQELFDWQTDEFGDVSSLHVRYILCVKEEFVDKIILEQSNVAVECIKYEQVCPIEIDFANKTYDFGKVDTETAFENKAQTRLRNEYDQSLKGYYAVMTDVDPVVYDENFIRVNESGAQEATCVEFVISRIEGTIVVEI